MIYAFATCGIWSWAPILLTPEKPYERAYPSCPGGQLPSTWEEEHSITPPIVENLASQWNLGVLVPDAFDLRDKYGGTKLSHACASRRILEIKGVRSFASIAGREKSSHLRQRMM
jgi:hypothetical protein